MKMVVAYLKWSLLIFTVGPRKSTKTSVSIIGLQADIRSRDLSQIRSNKTKRSSAMFHRKF